MTPAAKTQTPVPELVLSEAQARLVELRDRVGAGDQSVTAAQLADVEDEIHLAELRIEAAAELAARDAERMRLDRIREIVGSLTDGHLHAQAAGIVAKFDAVVAAVADLYAAKVGYEREIDAAVVELRRLGPLPAGVQVSRHGYEKNLTVAGQRYTPMPRYSIALVAEAVQDGIGVAAVSGPTGDHEGRTALQQIRGGHSRIERFRRLVERDTVDAAFDDDPDAA